MGVLYKRQFTEQMYEEDVHHIPVHGRLLWFLFMKLQRFNSHLEDVVVDLFCGGGKFLDVGCGDGDLCLKAKGKFKGVFGMDIAQNRIQRAQKRDQAIHFSVADLDEILPFKNEIFDAVTCIAAFQYCFDPYRVIKEFYRVLKKDGTLVIQVTNIAWLPYRIKLLFGGLVTTSLAQNYGWDGGVLHYFTFRTLEDFLRCRGFNIARTTGSGIFSKWRRWWLSLLSGDIIIKATKA